MAEPLPQRGVQALRQLVDDMARRRATLDAAPQAGRAAAEAARPGHQPASGQVTVPALDYFRDTWARLRVDQQLKRSLAQPPDNAGPLNSHLLALRALQQMRGLSPAYLGCFVAYLDALAWVDQAAASVAQTASARGVGAKKRQPASGRAAPLVRGG